MRALVVGGTGFIGVNVALALMEAGHEVAATRRRSSNVILARRLKIPLVSADLNDRDSLAEAMGGRDVVFMTAGHYPRFSIDTDRQVVSAVGWLATCYEAARRAGVARFVYVSSSATVAPSRDPATPATEANGLSRVPDASTYFAIKVALEQALTRMAQAGGPEVVTACPTACLGPFDWKVGTGSFVLGVATEQLAAFVDGRINVVDVRDVGRSLVAAAVSGVAGERYLLGGHNLTVSRLLRLMARRYGVPHVAAALSADEGRDLATREEARCHANGGRPALVREFVDLAVHGIHVDSAKAAAHLGHRARPLEETLDDARGWYFDNGYARRSTAPKETHAP